MDVEKQKRQIVQMLESSASRSDLYNSPSETESYSDESEDLRKRWAPHLMNSHVSIL
jgi:hypothetical protein